MRSGATSAVEEVRSLDEQRVRSTVSADVEALEPLLAGDLLYVHSSGASDTKNEYLEQLRSGRLRYEAMELRDTTYSAWGETVLGHGNLVAEAVFEGRTALVNTTFVDVWRASKEGWQLVALASCGTALPKQAVNQ